MKIAFGTWCNCQVTVCVIITKSASLDNFVSAKIVEKLNLGCFLNLNPYLISCLGCFDCWEETAALKIKDEIAENFAEDVGNYK